MHELFTKSCKGTLQGCSRYNITTLYQRRQTIVFLSLHKTDSPIDLNLRGAHSVLSLLPYHVTWRFIWEFIPVRNPTADPSVLSHSPRSVLWRIIWQFTRVRNPSVAPSVQSRFPYQVPWILIWEFTLSYPAPLWPNSSSVHFLDCSWVGLYTCTYQVFKGTRVRDGIQWSLLKWIFLNLILFWALQKSCCHCHFPRWNILWKKQ